MRLFFKVALGIFFVLPISSCRPSAYGAEKLMADEVGVPLPPRAIGIMGLGGNSRQIFGFTGLAATISENKGVTSILLRLVVRERSPNWESGDFGRCLSQVLGSPRLMGAPRPCPNLSYCRGLRGLVSVIEITAICDERGEGELSSVWCGATHCGASACCLTCLKTRR